VRAQLYDPVSESHQVGGTELIDQWQDSQSAVLWLDTEEVKTAEILALLKDRFQFHPLAVNDASRDRHPPKVEKFDEFLFILLRGLTAETEDIDFGDITVAFFLKDRLLVTRHSDTSASADWLWKKVSLKPSLLGRGSDHISVLLIGRIVLRYFPIVQALESRLETLEKDIFNEPDDEMLEELSGYKFRLTKLRRILTYHDQVVRQLRDDQQTALSSDLTHELNDVHEQLERTLSLCQMYYDLSSDLIDSYLSFSAHRLNRVMQLLTIVTVIFVPLTFLAGIYGMNFEHIPELKFRFAYPALLVLMFFIVFALLAIFRRKRWL
jgi:magnesium transporter